MGGVEVLPPQDLLYNRHRHRNHHGFNRNNLFSTSSMKSQSLRSANPGPAIARSLNHRKRSPPRKTPALPKVKKTTAVPLREKDTNKNTDHKNTSKPTSDLVIGQIKILKRGEVLPTSSLSAAKVDVSPKEVKKEEKVGATTDGGLHDLVVLPSADRLDPEPDVVPKKNIRISDFYAGSAFITSPEPSSLPVPVFFKKKEDVVVDDDCTDTNYEATSDLRRLLRLDLS